MLATAPTRQVDHDKAAQLARRGLVAPGAAAATDFGKSLQPGTMFGAA
jgi:hypothetical protein